MNEVDVFNIKNDLIKYADELGYKVSFTSNRSTAMNFKHKIIYIPPHNSRNVLYGLLHEIGHCIDYDKGNFNTEKYKTDKKYRLWKEFLGWFYGLKLRKKYDVPIDEYLKQAYKSWWTYVKVK